MTLSAFRGLLIVIGLIGLSTCVGLYFHSVLVTCGMVFAFLLLIGII